MRTHLLTVALTLVVCSQNANGWVLPECTLDPPNPTNAEAFTFTIGGTWVDTCVPDHLKVQVVGSTIEVDVHFKAEPTFCGDFPTPWELSATIGPLALGTYSVLGTLHYFEEPIPSHVDTPICDIVVSDPEPACTPVSGLICEDTTWTAKDGPYCVTSSIVVGCGATLTVEPGVHVCFPRGQLGLAVGSGAFGEGTLVARGTENARITFTSCEPEPEPGDWVSINFTSSATSATFDDDDSYLDGSILEHVIVEYAGGGSAVGGVMVTESSPYIVDSVIRRNRGRGVFISGAFGLMLVNNTITENSGLSDGAGVYLEHSVAPLLEGNRVTGNSGRDGAGVHLNQSSAALLNGNIITGNSNEHGDNGGGGIYLESCESPTLMNNMIKDNVARSTGGGFYLLDSINATVSDNTITGNIIPHRGFGAGIAITNSDMATITNNDVADNSIPHCFKGSCSGIAFSQGGGIYVAESHSVIISRNTITRNRIDVRDGGGGGIHLEHCDSATLEDNLILVNTASGSFPSGSFSSGGGLSIWFCNSPSLAGNRVVGNSATGSGGGLALVRSPSSTLLGNVLMRNAAPRGGGILLGTADDCLIRDTVIASNMTADWETAGGIHVSGYSPGLGLSDSDENGRVVMLGNTGYDMVNNNSLGPLDNDIIASNVWWGTQDADDIQSRVWDFFNDASKAFVVWDPPAPTGPFDFNGDGEILRDDLNDMVACLGGPDAPIEEPCTLGDLDRNGVVDLFDFATFQTVVRAP